MLKAIKVHECEVPAKDRKYRPRANRIYLWPEGETILQNLANRHSRPTKQWRKEVIPQVLEQLGYPKDAKVRFSQKAGCRCGCSPGWIMEGYYNKELFAHVCESVD